MFDNAPEVLQSLILGLVNAPASVVEPLIGLSIIWMAIRAQRRPAAAPAGDHVCFQTRARSRLRRCAERAAIARPRNTIYSHLLEFTGSLWQ
jgi:hypothetical protein